MTFERYTHGQDDIQPQQEAPQETGPRVRIHGTTYLASSNAGEITDRTLNQAKGTTAELNPYHGTDSILATARHPQGLPVTEVVASTLIEVNGIQATAAFWASEGVLQKNTDGTFSVSSTKPVEAAQVDTSEHHPVNDHDMSTINAALAEIDQGSVDGLAALGVGVAVGRLDAAALTTKFSQASGHDTEQSHARLVSIKDAYQAQANSAITSRYGITPADLPAFYQWARTSQQGKLQEAVHKQLHQHDVSGYRPLAAQWLAETPPSVASLKAAGLPTRMQDESQQVFVQGQWMRASAAARAGLL